MRALDGLDLQAVAVGSCIDGRVALATPSAFSAAPRVRALTPAELRIWSKNASLNLMLVCPLPAIGYPFHSVSWTSNVGCHPVKALASRLGKPLTSHMRPSAGSGRIRHQAGCPRSGRPR